MKSDMRKTGGEEYFSTLVRLSPYAMVILNTQGNIIFQNPAALDLLGEHDQLNSWQSLIKLIHAEERRIVFKHFVPLLKSGGESKEIAEFRLQNNKGSWTWIQAVSEKIGDGPAAGNVFLSLRDFNTEKISSIYIRDLNKLLHQRAAELAESNAELERFAYLTSHDLQEPLRMISGFLQLLKKKSGADLDEEAQQYIGFALEGSERMKKMITGLLDYSRLGTNTEDMSPVDLNIIIAEVTELYREKLIQTGGKIEAGHLPVVRGKKLQLAQIFQNLIGNALKYRSREAPLIQISCVLLENGMWKITIRDNGIGIDQKFAEKIFVVFQRLHSQSEYPGTGIGLSICKKIAEQHGGSIYLEPQSGQGSAFALLLPATE